MDIGCQMYHAADQPRYTGGYGSCCGSYRRPEGCVSSPSLRSFDGGRSLTSPALTCEERVGARRGRGGGQSVDGMMSLDGGACTAWVLSGRPSVQAADIPRSSSYCAQQRRDIIVDDSHRDVLQPRAAHRCPSNDSCPVFDVECHQRRVVQTPVVEVLNVDPPSFRAAA